VTQRSRACAAVGAPALVVAALLALPAQARPTDVGSDLFTFDAGDDVDTFDTEHFRFHYTLSGTHTVPTGDGDANGVPDHVESLALIYEDALATYVALGFRAPLDDDGRPNNGGDGRFDVYLVDFSFNADGAYNSEVCDDNRCSGYMVQENDFRGYSYPSARVGNLTVASHELFHAVQAAYDASQPSVFAEGTAVWASEAFDANLSDLEGFSSGYLDDAESPLDTAGGGPVDLFTYGASVFFQFLSERHDSDLIVALLEATEDGARGVADPDWFHDALPAVLADVADTFADVFFDFTVACVVTDDKFVDDTAVPHFENGDALARRTPEDAALPLSADPFLVFTSSSRLVEFAARGRSTVDAALADADPTQLAGLRVALVAHNVVTDDVRVATGVDRASIAATDDDDLYLLVTNTNPDGDGARPRLCAGDAAEVDACVAAASEGEGEGEGDDDDDDDDDSGGCACAGVDAAAVSGVALLALGRRRRQRRAPCSRPS
jgi:hypothetical protein